MLDQYEFYHYLPVTDDAMDWGLYVTGAGRGRIPARQSYPPAGHPSLYQFDWRRGRTLPEFQIILITDGAGVFESEPTGRRNVPPDTLILLFPGVWHRYGPDPATGWRERWISLNGEIVHRLMDQQPVRPAEAVCRPPDVSQIRQRFDLLLDRIHDRPAANTIQLSLRAMGLIAEVIEQRGGPGPQARDTSPICGLQPPASRCTRQSTVEDPLIAQTLDLIWTHSHRPLSVIQLVAHLPVTRRTLERRFALERGHSILDEINLCRASRARRLLRETDLPIKTVAYLAGFTSQERMRITFRSQDECSPAEYRRRFRMSQNKGMSRP
jgi:AraC-like DNA-binding protein